LLGLGRIAATAAGFLFGASLSATIGGRLCSMSDEILTIRRENK
jgi:hypothetical protein